MTQQKRLAIVLGLNLVMIVGLVIIGLSSHSLGVLAAGGDYAADSFAIILGIIGIQISRHPHGNPKATTYVAFINAFALLVVTVMVIFEGVHRLTTHNPQIEGLSVAMVSAVATIFMFIGVYILGKDAGKEDLHMRSVFLDTISDGVSSAAVAVSGIVIFLTGKFYWLDSTIAVFIGLIIGFGAIKLLYDIIIALRTHTALKVD